MPKVLIVTNDFPPRAGGIQFFVHALAMRLPPEDVRVYAPAWEGAAGFDAQLPFPVVRHPTSLMLPVPAVARRAEEIIKREGCDTVVFGAAAPLGLLAPQLRRAGARRIVALTHGHEAGWASLPGARAMLRRIGDNVDTVTYLGEYTRLRLSWALSRAAAERMTRLAPGVDTSEFHPGAGGAAVRERFGLGTRPVVVCVSRMVPRKGQDTLIRTWPLVRVGVPDAVLFLVGADAQAQTSPQGGWIAAQTVPEDFVARSVRRPPRRVPIYPRYQAEPDEVYPRYYPGPDAVRVCNATYAQEYRPSGPVIVPHMTCVWRRG